MRRAIVALVLLSIPAGAWADRHRAGASAAYVRAQGSQLDGIQPCPHAVIEGAYNAGLTDTGKPGELALDIQRGIVREEYPVKPTEESLELVERSTCSSSARSKNSR